MRFLGLVALGALSGCVGLPHTLEVFGSHSEGDQDLSADRLDLRGSYEGTTVGVSLHLPLSWCGEGPEGGMDPVALEVLALRHELLELSEELDQEREDEQCEQEDAASQGSESLLLEDGVGRHELREEPGQQGEGVECDHKDSPGRDLEDGLRGRGGIHVPEDTPSTAAWWESQSFLSWLERLVVLVLGAFGLYAGKKGVDHMSKRKKH